MLRRIKRNKGLLMGFLMLSVVACDSKGVFDAYLPLSQQKWEAANTLDFSFEVNGWWFEWVGFRKFKGKLEFA